MAVRIALSNAGLSSGTWKRAEAYSLALVPSAANYDDVNTARTFAVTFANAGNQQGIVLALKVASIASGVLTIKLQNAAGGVTYTTDTFTLSSTFSSVTLGQNTQIFYFPLTTYACLAGAGNYRYEISCNVASRLSLWRTAAAGAYFYACILDASTAAPSSGDTLIVANTYTLTNDATFTYGTADGYSLILCEGSIWNWLSTAGAAYTATFTQRLMPSNSARIDVGTSVNPIPVAKLATINVSAVTTYWVEGGYYAYWGYPSTIYNFYGFEDLSLSTRSNGTAAALQKVITTKEDMSAVWQNGDGIILFGKALTSAGADTATYTIASDVGTTLTLNANIDKFLYDKGGVLNTTRATTQLGIKIIGVANLLFVASIGVYVGSFNFHGCYITDLGLAQFWSQTISGSNSIYRCYIVLTGTTYYGIYFVPTNITTSLNLLDVFIVTPAYTANGIVVGLYANNLIIVNSTWNTVFVKNPNAPITVNQINCTFTKIITEGSQRTAGWIGLSIYGASNGVSDSLFEDSGDGVRSIATIYNAFSDCIMDNNGIYNINLVSNATGLTFDTCKIGATLAAGTKDINAVANTFVQALLSNCQIGTSGVSDITTLIANSYIRFHTYNITANDHGCFEQRGNFQSTGSGLIDTWVHTAGATKFAIRLEPLSSINNLAWSFTVPTGDISTKTMTVAVWLRINKKAYWAGVNQLPRLNINYDNGTIAYAQATAIAGDTVGVANFGWQLLSVTFTPATAYGQITVSVTGRTDAVGSNAYFYIDDFSVLYPAGYQLDLGGLDLWANALPVVPPIATNLSAMSVWVASSLVAYGANTMGAALQALLAFGAAPTVMQIADQVWDELKAGHIVAGSFGELVQIIEKKVDDATVLGII